MRFTILLLVLLPLGCASSVLDKYDHQHSYHCRIDNPDQDSLWDTSDKNGNGLIDQGEIAGPVFDFAKLAGKFGEETDTLPQPSSPGFPESLAFGLGTGAVGVVDDLSGNGLSFFFIDNDGDGEHSVGEPFGFDFGDLHTFNISFDRILTAPQTETHGMQVSSQHRFSAKKQEVEETEQSLELSYGARYFRLTENFLFDATGSILGKAMVDMEYDNRLIGPQLAVEWKRQQHGWNLSAGSTLMLGYNFAKGTLHGIVGQDLVPGGLNSPLNGRPLTVITKREHEELASIAELSAQATYPLRRDLDLHFGYRALYISDLRHAGESIDFDLPSFGILDNGSNGAWLEGLHASVEWRR